MSLVEKILAGNVITCIDAGAAGGLTELQKLRSFITLYSFEPLNNSYLQLKKNTSFSNTFKKHMVLPFALYSSCGSRNFYIAGRNSMSSLLEFDQQAFDNNFGFCKGSKKWKDGLLQNRTETAETTTLDIQFKENNINSIDFLKLDTQGTELEILKGSMNLLDGKKISIIKTEFSNIPVYKNQCTFAEIDHFLKSKGFVLVDCIYYPETILFSGEASLKKSIIREEPRIGAGGDAVYVLASSDINSESALKTGLILCSMGYFNRAFQLLEKAKVGNKEEIMQEIKPGKSYKKLLKEFIPPAIIKLVRAIRG